MNVTFATQLPDVISVVGKGIAEVAADKLNLTVAAEAVHDSAKEAQAKSTNVMNKIFKTLIDAGIDAKDIATLQYTLKPHYEHEEDLPPFPRQGKQKGFEVRNTVLVTLRNPSEAGRIMDLVVGSGATSLNLGYDDTVPEETRSLARKRAVADAQFKAQELAELAKVKLGEPLQISEVEQPWTTSLPPVAFHVPVPLPDSPPLVRPSEVRIEIVVEMTFQIKRD